MSRRSKPFGIAATSLALACLTAAAACGSPDHGTVALGPGATTTTTTTSTTVPGATTTSTTSPAPPEDLTGFRTDPYRAERSIVVPPVPQVTAIRAAAHNGFERVVFDLTGLPGADSVRYVDKVVADGSGLPVTVAGSAYLLVRFEDAQAHTDAGAALLAMRSTPGLNTVREIVMAGDYEGYVTIALGLTQRAPFRVLELTNPARVVVDVRTA